MNKLPLSALAETDLEDIASYIAQSSPRSAERMVQRLLDQCRRVCDAPLSYPPCEDLLPGIRRAVCRPYLVYFIVDQNGVRIERIIHGARDISALLGGEP